MEHPSQSHWDLGAGLVIGGMLLWAHAADRYRQRKPWEFDVAVPPKAAHVRVTWDINLPLPPHGRA